MPVNEMCVILRSFIFTKSCLMSPVCADTWPCFRKHAFHFHGLLSPGCFSPPIKKPRISSPFLTLHHLSPGRSNLPMLGRSPLPPFSSVNGSEQPVSALGDSLWMPESFSTGLLSSWAEKRCWWKGPCRQPLWDRQHLDPIMPRNKVPPVAWDQVTSPLTVEVISLPTLWSLRRVWLQVPFFSTVLEALRKCGRFSVCWRTVSQASLLGLHVRSVFPDHLSLFRLGDALWSEGEGFSNGRLALPPILQSGHALREANSFP